LGLFFKVSYTSTKFARAKVLKKHEELALRYFWSGVTQKAGSREVWLYVNEKLGEGRKISRATIINFLKAMDKEGVLDSKEVKARGGPRSARAINSKGKLISLSPSRRSCVGRIPLPCEETCTRL